MALREIDVANLSISIPAAGIDSLIGNTPLIGFRRITAHLPEDWLIYRKMYSFLRKPSGPIPVAA